MAETSPAIKYIKLPGTGYRETVSVPVQLGLFFIIGFLVLLLRGNRVQLWLGPDHLLVVDYTGRSEEYKRFYFKDIQGVVLRRTKTGKAWNIVLAVVLLFFVLIAATTQDSGFIAFCVFVAVFISIFLLANTIKGPTCEAELFTAVQSEKLVSLGRIPTAHKVLQRLQPLIVEAQGELRPEDMAAPQTEQSTAGTITASYETASQSLPAPVLPYPGKMHLIMSIVAVIGLFWTLLFEDISSPLTRVMTLVITATYIIVSIIALNKQKETDLPKGLRLLPWIFLGQVVFTKVADFIFTIFFVVASRPGNFDAGDKIPAQVVLMAVSAAIKGFGGLYGIAAWRKYKNMQADVSSGMDVPPELPIN